MSDRLRQMSCGRDLDKISGDVFGRNNLCSSTISKDLNFDVSRALKETFNEDRSISEGSLRLADRTLEGRLEVRLLSHDAHTAPSTTHSGFGYNWEAIVLYKCCSILVGVDGAWSTETTGTPTFMAVFRA